MDIMELERILSTDVGAPWSDALQEERIAALLLDLKKTKTDIRHSRIENANAKIPATTA